MPIYEYHCNKCNIDFEYLVFGKEDSSCPSCNTKDVSRLMSVFGFLSKGQNGETVNTSASTSSCGSCSASSCSGCSH